MPTGAELINRVADNAKMNIAAGSPDRTRILGYLQEAADRIALEAEVVHDPTPTIVSLVAGTSQYDVTASPFAISGLIVIDEIRVSDASVTNFPVDQVSMADIDVVRTGTQAQGTPYIYAYDNPMLVLSPAPGVSTTLEIKCVVDAPTIADSAAALTFIPKALQWGCMATFATARAKQYKQQADWKDYESAYLNDRTAGLPAARRWVARTGGRQGIQPSTRGIVRTSPSQDFGPF